MFNANKYNYSRYKSPNTCPICGNEVPVSSLFCEQCGMRMHNHQLKHTFNNQFARESSQPRTMSNAATSHTASLHNIHKPYNRSGMEATFDSFRESIKIDSLDSRYDVDDLLDQMQVSVENRIFEDFTERKIFEKLGKGFVEQRDFGLDKCTEAAKEIFNLGVFMSWANLYSEQKMSLALAYAQKVAEAFELMRFKGVSFEDMHVWGFNRGDGIVHLSNNLVAERKHNPHNGHRYPIVREIVETPEIKDYPYELPDILLSPFLIIDTITHELRHQYQFEAVEGYHNVPEEVVKEWMISAQIYHNDVESSCFDPWGYTYNPREVDARYAGETVVRNISRDWFNAKGLKGKKTIDRILLRQSLSREGYPERMLDSTVHSLLQLEGKAAAMLEAWLNKGTKPEFDNIEGVNSDLLRNRLRMKEPAIILSYGMLVNNPSRSSRYFKSLFSD